MNHFTYVTVHSDSPNFPSLHLRHSSFSNPSLALPTSQLILQPFRCFTYVTTHSPTLLSLLLRHRIFTYVTWRAAHERDGMYIRVMTSHNTCTSGTSRVLTEASLQRLTMEALIPAPVDCEVRSMIKFLNAQSIVPIKIRCHLCQVYGHTRLEG